MIFESCCFASLEIPVLLPAHPHLPLPSHQLGMMAAARRIVPADKASLSPLTSPPGHAPTAARHLLFGKASPDCPSTPPPRAQL